jgi:hypothetical protein
MATLVPRGFDDVLTERMVSLSTAFVTEQAAAWEAAQDPVVTEGGLAAVRFRTERNLLSAPSAEQLKIESWLIWGIESQQDAQSGTSKMERKDTMTLVADLYVRKAADLAEEHDEEMALSRLSYFKEQVKVILFCRANEHFGFPQGTIQKKSNFRYQQFGPTNEDNETWIVGGRVSVDLDFTWTPPDVTGIPIEEISVTNTAGLSGKWAALYTYEEAP